MSSADSPEQSLPVPSADRIRLCLIMPASAVWPLSEHLPSADGSAIATPIRAWIVFAHGSSDPDWSRPIQAIVRRLSERLGEHRVALAFLERQPPTLEQAAAALIAHGATHVTVRPMFLGIGGHLKRDLPVKIEALRARWTQVRFELGTPIGESRRVADAIFESIVEEARHPAG
jgi:sirohydrochlorin cobaltochelatase